MINLYKFISIYKKIEIYYNNIIVNAYLYILKTKNSNFLIDKKFSINGLPIIKLGENSTLIIDENLKLNNNTKYNMVGIYKKCSIAVKNNAILKIGKNCGFSGVSIFCSNKITIGNNVTCGGNVSIWDTDFHPINFKARRLNTIEEIRNKPVEIGNDVFIGANSLILKGVVIGDRSVIAAGSVVTKSIPSSEIWGGNPAVFLKKAE